MASSILSIILIDCAKNYRFIELEACKSKDEVVSIKKCEVDEIFLTLKADVKLPITKALVSNHLATDSLAYNSISKDSKSIN